MSKKETMWMVLSSYDTPKFNNHDDQYIFDNTLDRDAFISDQINDGQGVRIIQLEVVSEYEVVQQGFVLKEVEK